MTVEDLSNDRFPIGMRVLAVDDNPTCLKVLENLLRRCEYHVTTTSQAIMALKLLRENKDKFDLVISDVHMPDMDGFRLLELVGLEMDLPVIMLSANSDTKAVMKGITHGACDYLVKPVRIEELKNIWQHVVRRKKIDSKDHSNPGCGEGEKFHQGACDSGTMGTTDPNGKLCRKRKDQNDEEDDDSDENEHANEDPSAQKKPRVVWSVELHRKFVAAVNQLGIDKAVPKRILDLMNVERLTRENVASHLQKYRLYLKRISTVASQQANMAAALGGKDLSFLPMGSFDGFGDFHALAGSCPPPKPTIASFQAGGTAGRLNTPTNLAFCGHPSSGMIQIGQNNNAGNSVNDLGKLQQIPRTTNQHGTLLQGMPLSLDLDQLQQNKLSSPIDDSTVFPIGEQQIVGIGGFSDTTMTNGGFESTVLNVSNNPLMLQSTQQHTFNGGLGNHSSVRVGSLNQGSFDIGVGVSSHLPDLGRLNDTWQDALPLSGFASNVLPMGGATFSNEDFCGGNLRESCSSVVPNMEISPLDSTATTNIRATVNNSPTGRDNSKLSNYASMGNDFGQSTNYTLNRQLEDHHIFHPQSKSSFPNHGIVGFTGQRLGGNNGVPNRRMDMNMMGQSFGGGAFQNFDFGKSTSQSQMKLKEEYLLEQAKLLGGFIPNNSRSDDLMSALIKREREDALMDANNGCDIYPLGTRL